MPTWTCAASGSCAASRRPGGLDQPTLGREIQRLLGSVSGDQRSRSHELEGDSSTATSVVFLQQLRAHHPKPLIVIWDNGPAHGGDQLRAT
jgi:hypothetical protein